MSEKQNDILTQLPDNRALIEELKSLGTVNYFLLNIDNFSNINFAYGFEIGDAVLVQIAKYLKMFKPANATMYRFCSDRFVLIDETDLSKEAIVKTCESILSFFSHTDLEIDEDISFRISFTIGVSKAKGMINVMQAEWAMKEARVLTRNSYSIFDPLSDFVHERQQDLYWMHKIKDAVDNEEIVAYFQPMHNNHTGKVEKYECLARIKDDEEYVSPHRFLKAAKLTGNTSLITKAIIAQSFKKFANTSCEFSINITSEDLYLGYLEKFLLRYVQKYSINPAHVVLEILEDILSLGEEAIQQQIDSLRMNGFKIAIDDFGAENSNFARLLDVHPDYIKIDGAFIKNILTDIRSQTIVDAIIMVCRKSGIKIIAEYIHNEQVQAKVKELGIDYSQGFYFGAPSRDLLEQ